MNADTALEWVKLGTEHKWLALAVVVIGWLTSLTSDWSKFPITVPGRWQPAVAAGLGLVYGVLQKVDDGMPLQKALIGGLLVALATGGLFDLVVNGALDGRVPPWLGWLSFAKKEKLPTGGRSNPPPKGDGQ